MPADHEERFRRAGCTAAVVGAITAYVLYTYLWGLRMTSVFRDNERKCVRAMEVATHGGDLNKVFYPETVRLLERIKRRRGVILHFKVQSSYGDGFLATQYVEVEVKRKWASENVQFDMMGPKCGIVQVNPAMPDSDAP